MMRITDPLWPAVREVSRRCLKSTSLEFNFPDKYSKKIHQFDLLIQQFLPSRIHQSIHQISTTTMWSIQTPNGNHIASSEDTSSEDFVYIPLRLEEFWDALLQCCIELLQAGYPGCEDCIQDFKDNTWDEPQHRASLEQKKRNGDGFLSRQ
jgi:hypothetical protein